MSSFGRRAGCSDLAQHRLDLGLVHRHRTRRLDARVAGCSAGVGLRSAGAAAEHGAAGAIARQAQRQFLQRGAGGAWRWSLPGSAPAPAAAARTCSARRSSLMRASACMASTRISFSGRGSKRQQQSRHASCFAQLADGAHHHRQRTRRRGLQHLQQARQRALAADLGQRIHRALAHPPVLVLRRLDQVVDRALVLGLVQDLDGGAADVVVLVARPAAARHR